MPREWQKHWLLPDGSSPTSDQSYQAIFSSAEDDSPVGRIVRRNRIKETLGNLTLLTKPLNSSVSNGPFEGKRQALKDNSLLVLNQEVSALEDWSEEAIATRGKALFQSARVIWAFPATK
jgi:hypothetical protein